MSPTFPRATRATEFWRVNSYGYPNFAGTSDNSKEAWSTLLSFYDYSDYRALKDYWSSGRGPRRISHHSVESWKAAFEEFGILFVSARSNKVTITPAGEQLRDAADRKDLREFAWIGLHLLLRYPLRGPRRPKSSAQEGSDLLLYRFWYSALLDLDGYLWWTELERVLCRVFSTAEASDAVEDVRSLRGRPELCSQLRLPVDHRSGAFYNSLNQVTVHAGMNHLLMGTDDLGCPYGVTEPKRRQFVRREWLGLIRAALVGGGSTGLCDTIGAATARLPAAPVLGDEEEYFEYLGAPVTPAVDTIERPLGSVMLQGDRVLCLKQATHYTAEAEGQLIGPIATLCQLALGQRIILSHDERWTYLVKWKEAVDAYRVRVSVRRAKPISDFEIIRTLQEQGDA